MNKKKLEAKFKVWESLVDISVYFALAGIKLKGNSERESWKLLRQRWERSREEHHKADLDIVRKLNAARDKDKQAYT